MKKEKKKKEDDCRTQEVLLIADSLTNRKCEQIRLCACVCRGAYLKGVTSMTMCMRSSSAVGVCEHRHGCGVGEDSGEPAHSSRQARGGGRSPVWASQRSAVFESMQSDMVM